ncbi:DUF3916 domain-containing protein [Gottfriedia acidiceleris]|uniref:DUF3916 domain-containing protein n=1 Tax=Gottfriedia acidiceleris TaxID=371036 RepID=UPI00101D3E49|nr:DUF3916 domain-containing protein [Gottfriedia acidiceleris]
MTRQKKLRGERRRIRNLKREIAELSKKLPTPRSTSSTYKGYDAFHFRMFELIGEFDLIPRRKKRDFLQEIINLVSNLHNLKTAKESEYRVKCFFFLPHMEYIVVSIGYTKAGLDDFYRGLYYNGRFKKEMIPIVDPNYLQREWQINVPPYLEVKGYHCNFKARENETMWLIGNLS